VQELTLGIAGGVTAGCSSPLKAAAFAAAALYDWYVALQQIYGCIAQK
jgi:hypothetical protein